MLTVASRMQKMTFPAGTLRQVCVSKAAIEANVRKGTNYPTVIVVENMKLHEFHAANVTGLLQYNANRPELPAKVFIETLDAFDAYIDPWAEQTFLRLPRPWYKKWAAKAYSLWDAFLRAPIISCISGRA